MMTDTPTKKTREENPCWCFTCTNTAGRGHLCWPCWAANRDHPGRPHFHDRDKGENERVRQQGRYAASRSLVEAHYDRDERTSAGLGLDYVGDEPDGAPKGERP
jgi:hypothetical protein